MKACGGDVQEWERRWHDVQAEATQTPLEPADASDAPYRGLARFEPDDSSRFFGRTRLTDDLVELTRAHRITVVLGPSGSGKSSLLRAGLVPRLQSTTDQELRPAAIRILTPGPRPAREHRERLTAAAGAGDTWLVVDQFEETFTLCQDPDERQEFLRRLMQAHDPGSRLRVVLGMRADFYARCLEHQDLATLLRKASLPVGPMTPDELREVIVKPAATAGLIVERALTARLMGEVTGEPGGLPLLSYVLLETWRRRCGRTLTLQAYEAAGGLHGAIAQTAEDLYTQLTPAQAQTARRILLRLITPGEGAPDTRRPADRSEVTGGSTADYDPHIVLHRLARARLVTLDDDTVDLAHEALLTAWPRLRDWIDQARERLIVHRRLTDAATAWHEVDRDPGGLYRGIQLAAAADAFSTPDACADLTALEHDFLAASLAARDQEQRAAARAARRTRRLTRTLTVLLALALVAGLFAWNQYRDSEHQRTTAVTARQIAKSRQLAAQSADLLETKPDLASLLALHAYDTRPTREATTSLRAAAGLPLNHRFDRGLVTSVASAAYSPDGRTLAIGGSGRDDETRVELRDAVSGKTKRSFTGILNGVSQLAFDPGGRLLAASDDDRRVWQWDEATGARHIRLRGAADGSVVFSPDARILATSSGVGTGPVRLWNPESGHLRATLNGPVSHVWALAFRPDSRTLVVGGKNGKGQGIVQLWDAVTLKPRPSLLVRDGAVTAAAVTADGRTLATATQYGRVRLWDPHEGRTRSTFFVPAAEGISLAFSPDGRTLAGTGNDERVRLWETATGKARATLNGHSSFVECLAFSPDGHSLASSAIDGEVRLWDLTTDQTRTPLIADPGELVAMAFSPSGRLLATGSNSDQRGGEVRLWDVATGTVHKGAMRGFSELKSVAFSPDGRTLAAVGSDEQPDGAVVRLWDVNTGRARATLTEPSGDVSALAFTSDGRLLTKGDTSGLRSWDVATGKAHTFPEFDDFPAMALTAAFSSDGRSFAAGDYKGRVHLWDIASGDVRATFPRLSEGVGALAFSFDGHTLAISGQTNGEIRLHDTATGKIRFILTARTVRGSALAFNPRGDQIVGSGSDGIVRLWDATLPQPALALRKICRAVNRDLTPQERATYLKDDTGRSPCRP
ncbi:hypothetical protein [Streptomyces sp. NPDC059063]|uniref:nSTAND1 domain-containing NTPase n=1 Tax=unclassified Streptomyces TaxID=2593676 RepID=UPI0036CA9923